MQASAAPATAATDVTHTDGEEEAREQSILTLTNVQRGRETAANAPLSRFTLSHAGCTCYGWIASSKKLRAMFRPEHEPSLGTVSVLEYST